MKTIRSVTAAQKTSINTA